MANSIMRLPAAPVEYIPSYRLQTVARRIHHLPLLLLLEIRPYTDLVDSHRDNLQKLEFLFLVKDKVISCIPNGPNNRANIHSNLNKILLRNALEPISKMVSSVLGNSKPNVIWMIRQIILQEDTQKISVVWILYYRKSNMSHYHSSFSLSSYL
jgi:hypothetical protein